MGKTLGDLSVRAVAYYVSDSSLSCVTICPDGTTESNLLGPIDDFLAVLDATLDGLQRTTDVARGKVRALREFAAQSGRRLLPPSITANPPDILVIIPHSVLHGVPLHLVHTDSGEPLCTVAGVTYASSLSEFVQCVSSNPARTTDTGSRPLTLEAETSDRRVAGYCADVLDVPATKFAAVMAGVESALGHRVTALGTRTTMKMYIDALNLNRPHLDALVVVAHGFLNPVDHQLSGLLMSSTDVVFKGQRHEALMPMSVPGAKDSIWYRDSPMTLPPAELEISRETEVLSIAEMRMDTLSGVPLVVLFGCSAGWSRVVKGDVPSSLGQTFLTLGSSTVIAPAWDAEVGVTTRWATHFFEAWARFRWPAALSAAYATRTLYEDSIAAELYGAITLRGDWL